MKRILPFLFAMLGISLAQEIVELPLPASNKIVVKLMFRNGSVCDPSGKEGLTRLTASMITESGTKKLSYAQIQNLLYPQASGYGVSVDKEVTIFTFQCHVDFATKFYPILRDLILTPRFDTSDFARVKSSQQTYVDQNIRSSSDEEYSKVALEHLLFRGTPYQHMVSGTSAGVSAITIEDVKQHYHSFFTRNNLMIGIAGKYTSAFLKTLKKDMQKLPATQPPLPQIKAPQQPSGFQVEIISKPGALGSAIFMGFPMDITRSSDDFAALMVANSWFGEHRKSYSHLYQKIRATRSMNYGDYSYIEWYPSGGSNMLPPPGVPRSSNYFSIWIRPVQIAKGLRAQYQELKDSKLGHAHFAVRMAIRELDLLIQNGMSQEDFELTRTFLRSYIKLYAQTPDDQLGYMMDSRFYGRKDYLKEMDALLAGLTREKVNQTIQKYWQVKNFYVAVVTDESEAGPLKESLEQNLVSLPGYSDFLKNGLPKDVLEEDAVVAKYPLPVKQVTIIPTTETLR